MLLIKHTDTQQHFELPKMSKVHRASEDYCCSQLISRSLSLRGDSLECWLPDPRGLFCFLFMDTFRKTGIVPATMRSHLEIRLSNDFKSTEFMKTQQQWTGLHNTLHAFCPVNHYDIMLNISKWSLHLLHKPSATMDTITTVL